MKLAAMPSAMATVLAALLVLAPVLVGCGRNGHDTATYADGSTYSGEWKDGNRHGKGTETYDDDDGDGQGFTYSGEWADDERNGQGTETWFNGSTYRGEWKDGLRHGYGTGRYADIGRYTGWWEDGEPAP